MGQKELKKANLRIVSKDEENKAYAVSINNVDEDASIEHVQRVKNALQELIQDDITSTSLNLTYEYAF